MTKPVKIQFFGAFRKYGEGEVIDIPEPCSVADFKALLIKKIMANAPDFSGEKLVMDSAIACNDAIIGAGYRVQPGDSLAILPPVCGG